MNQPSVSELLYVRDLTLKRGHALVLDQIEVALHAGDRVALLGPNGSGKTSLLFALAHLHTDPLINVWRWNSKTPEPTDFQPQYWAQRVAYVGAELRTEFPVTVAEAIAMGHLCWVGRAYQRRTRDAVAQAVQVFGLEDFVHRDLRTLSGGEAQRVALARAFVQDAPVMLLDEALSKMDLHHQVECIRQLNLWVAAQKRAYVWVSHDLNFACDWAETIWFIKDGKLLASGGISEVLTPFQLGRLYPGLEFQIGTCPMGGRPKVFFAKSHQTQLRTPSCTE